MAYEPIKVTWHCHSCFLLDNGHWQIVLDPYRSSMIGYPPLKLSAHAYLTSHDHADHNEISVVALQKTDFNPILRVETSVSWPADTDPDRYQVKTVLSHHDAEQGARRGLNRIHIIRTHNMTIAHLGDLGHMLSDEQIRAIGSVDLLLIPVGGYYTIDAVQAVETILKIKPRTVAPMHYQIGLGSLPIASVDDFAKKINPHYPVHDLHGSSLQLDQTADCVCYLFSFDRTIHKPA